MFLLRLKTFRARLRRNRLRDLRLARMQVVFLTLTILVAAGLLLTFLDIRQAPFSGLWAFAQSTKAVALRG